MGVCMCMPALGRFLGYFFYLFSCCCSCCFFWTTSRLFTHSLAHTHTPTPFTVFIVAILSSAVDSIFDFRCWFRFIFPQSLTTTYISYFSFFFLPSVFYHPILFHWFCTMLPLLLLLAILRFYSWNVLVLMLFLLLLLFNQAICSRNSRLNNVKNRQVIVKIRFFHHTYTRARALYTIRLALVCWAIAAAHGSSCQWVLARSNGFGIAELGMRFNSLVGFGLILLMTVIRSYC